MKRVIRSLALLGAAAALVITGPAMAQKQGGTLTYGVKAGVPNYDLQASTSYGILHRIEQHYSTLLTFDWKNYPKLTGDIAESWTVSPISSSSPSRSEKVSSFTMARR